jgi:Collagen triple helix repeat (20 copies)
MFSKLRSRLTYANLTATLALLFAMSGGAYAASHYLITSTKQISPKVLKALKGNAGPAGTNGANGANGAGGPPGEKGAPGSNGSSGSNGKDGTNGKDGASVTSTALPVENAHCKEGGSEFTAAEAKKTYACNGSPWAAGGTLPKGASETGEWSATHHAVEEEEIRTAISFTVPLAAALDESHVHFIKSGESLPAGCAGTIEKPEATSGNLCVFAAAGMSVSSLTEFILNAAGAHGADRVGALLLFGPPTTGQFTAHGTWVVTG